MCSRAQDMIEQQLLHLVELGAAVHTLVAGDESGHGPEQLQAVQDLVRKLNEDRLAASSQLYSIIPLAPGSYPAVDPDAHLEPGHDADLTAPESMARGTATPISMLDYNSIVLLTLCEVTHVVSGVRPTD